MHLIWTEFNLLSTRFHSFIPLFPSNPILKAFTHTQTKHIKIEISQILNRKTVKTREKSTMCSSKYYTRNYKAGETKSETVTQELPLSLVWLSAIRFRSSLTFITLLSWMIIFCKERRRIKV
jgi:hypothetical protein